MKVLLDECVPKRLRREFAEHQVSTVDEAGFKSLKNGDLLRAASGRFEVLITVDRNLPFQQNLVDLKLALIVLIARSNSYPDLKLTGPRVVDALKTIKPGEIIRIQSE